MLARQPKHQFGIVFETSGLGHGGEDGPRDFAVGLMHPMIVGEVPRDGAARAGMGDAELPAQYLRNELVRSNEEGPCRAPQLRLHAEDDAPSVSVPAQILNVEGEVVAPGIERVRWHR